MALAAFFSFPVRQPVHGVGAISQVLGRTEGIPTCIASPHGVRWKVAVSKLEAIIEDLKTLSPDRLDSAADYIHKLKTISHAERAAIIDQTSGSLTKEEGDELARIIEEGCEQVDERNW